MTKPFPNEAKAQVWLKGRLAIAEARFSVLWRELHRGEFVRLALEEEDGPDELLREARRQLKISEDLRVADKRKGRKRAVEAFAIYPGDALSELEKMRAKAFYLYLASLADMDSDVVEYRNRFLDGRALSQMEAVSFLTSPATRHLSRDKFLENKIPLLNHKAEYLSPPDNADIQMQVNLRVRWNEHTQDISGWSPYFSRGENTLEFKILLYSTNPHGLPDKRVAVWPHSSRNICLKT